MWHSQIKLVKNASLHRCNGMSYADFKIVYPKWRPLIKTKNKQKLSVQDITKQRKLEKFVLTNILVVHGLTVHLQILMLGSVRKVIFKLKYPFFFSLKEKKFVIQIIFLFIYLFLFYFFLNFWNSHSETNFLFPVILSYGRFGICASFRHSVFDRFTRFGV